MPLLTPADVVRIGGGESVPRTTLAALGPGSGLGVSALVPAGDAWALMTGEGGHVSMPAATREEQDVIALLRDRFDGHCSAERVLSGPGLVNLYVALAELAGRGRPDGHARGRHESREAKRAAGAQDARRCSSRCSAPSRAISP